ncbi:MAG: alpha/beta hydrolase [Anaerolineae bacterium]|nr:alpha/beta hydrolase [Anaerolineae bacterium]
MRPHQDFAAVNGTRLYYEVSGSGQPLVLIHGFTLDLRMWDDQFAALARTFQVIRYDMRGFGQSAMPTSESYTHADDLKALLGHLRVDQAHLVGLSKGGAIALDFTLAYPQRVKKLVLIDSVLGGYSWSPEATARQQLIWQAASQGGIAAAKAAWLAHPYFVPIRRQPAVAARLAHIVADYSGWHFVNRDTEHGLTPPASQRLRDIHVPTLVIVGEEDLPDVGRIADLLHQQVPNVQKVVVPAVGHMANMEAPDLVNTALLQFLTEGDAQ